MIFWGCMIYLGVGLLLTGAATGIIVITGRRLYWFRVLVMPLIWPIFLTKWGDKW
jgi:hypothetical protein